MLYRSEDISAIINGELLHNNADHSEIKNIVFDTRKISFPQHSIFVALSGKSDGHNFISDAYSKGIRNFMISKKIDLSLYPTATFILCSDCLIALQTWASYHRSKISNTVIAITGSNGKTIVKEWLSKALTKKYKIGKSPLSYNSQIGVALSLLQLDLDVDLAIIEAGISKKNEMSILQKMIRPEVGIFTNIGDAHSSGFSNQKEKLQEKLLLLREAEVIIYNKDIKLVNEALSQRPELKTISWGNSAEADIHLITTNRRDQLIELAYNSDRYSFRLPFTNSIMVDNCMHVIAYLLLDNWSESEIQNSIDNFSTLPNRLEVKEGINNCLLIDDSYSSDQASMQQALEKLDQLAEDKNRVLIISPFDQQKNTEQLYENLAELINEKNISLVIGIGFSTQQKTALGLEINYPNTSSFISEFDNNKLSDSAVLIKGASKYQLQKISAILSQQIHQTCLETNLTAITHNLNTYKAKLNKTTKVMAVVKAEAYGSGSNQMVSFLQQQKIDYLAVALIDEGVRLRKQNCKLPVMIFNIQENNLDQLWEYELEPEVYSFSILKNLIKVAEQKNRPLKIHLKLDSGMHRLGFIKNEIQQLINTLKRHPKLQVTSIFSHLASSEQAANDTYTAKQLELFDQLYEQLATGLGIMPLKHILNTAGIVRFPQHQYDMVRLGLGLYGIDETKTVQNELIRAHTLSAKVIQIKSLTKGETTGYNRSGSNPNDTKIAIVSIGYADGLMRQAGNGLHRFTINGQSYPSIGNICMDVMILDIGKDAKLVIGDDVIIFGPDDPIEKLANNCNTITYEIISRIAPRVKRSYIYD